MVMIQSSTTATAIFIATIFISSLVTNSAFAQAQSMNQSMNNASDSANQAAQNVGQSANKTGEGIQGNASQIGSNISEGAKNLGGNITEGAKGVAETLGKELQDVYSLNTKGFEERLDLFKKYLPSLWD